LAAFKSFRSTGVLVLIHSKTEKDQIPASLKELNHSTGRSIPRILVSSSDASQGIDAVSYESLKRDARKAARELRKKLETTSLSSTALTEPSEPEADLLAPEQIWTNQKGQDMTAAVVDLSDETVTFLMPNESEVPYQITDLSAESQKRLADLQPK